MFNVDEVPVFQVPVPVIAPGGIDQSFQASFEALMIDEFSGFNLSTPDGCTAFLERAWLKVDDVVDKDGNPVPDSTELRARIANMPWCRAALVRAYLDGLQPAARGN